MKKIHAGSAALPKVQVNQYNMHDIFWEYEPFNS